MTFGMYEQNMNELQFNAVKKAFDTLSYELKNKWFKKHETDYDIMYIEIHDDEKSPYINYTEQDFYGWYDIFMEFKHYRKGMFIDNVEDKNFAYISKI